MRLFRILFLWPWGWNLGCCRIARETVWLMTRQVELARSCWRCYRCSSGITGQLTASAHGIPWPGVSAGISITAIDELCVIACPGKARLAAGANIREGAQCGGRSPGKVIQHVCDSQGWAESEWVESEGWFWFVSHWQGWFWFRTLWFWFAALILSQR